MIALDIGAATVWASLVAAAAGLASAIIARRTHVEVRTNHGVRLGERVETLGDDVTIVKEDVRALKLATAKTNMRVKRLEKG
jgi:hypothetical protein